MLRPQTKKAWSSFNPKTSILFPNTVLFSFPILLHLYTDSETFGDIREMF